MPAAVASGPQWYRHCGLAVESDIALTGLMSGEARHGRPADVRVRRAPLPSEPVPGLRFEATAGRCTIALPGAGSCEIRDGRLMTVAALPDADAANVRGLVLGSSWGALLHQRGHVPLHGGVVEIGDAAWAFCGPSGAGKSTLVATLAQRGHVPISDDLTRLDTPSDGPPLVWRSSTLHKLDRPAVDELGLIATDEAEREPGSGKLLVPWEPGGGDEPTPLGGFVVLAWGAARIVRLRGGEAARRLLSAITYRPQLLEAVAELARAWRTSISLCQRVPVWELSRPRAFDRRQSSTAAIVAEILRSGSAGS